MKQSLLLLEDIYALGRSGEIVYVKEGYARNFLLPQKKALPASQRTVKLQQKLREEREKQAVIDKNEAEKQAKELEELVLSIVVKVDVEGNLYGSVSAADVADLLDKQNVKIDRRNVLLPKSIKNLGKHTVQLRLKENVLASVVVDVQPEGGMEAITQRKKRKQQEEAKAEAKEKEEVMQEYDELADEAKE